MSRRGGCDVAVVGAGMVGAALALELARASFDVTVVEPRRPDPWRADDDVDLRVVALAPSSVDLFRRLGLWESVVAARTCAFRRMCVWDATAPGGLAFDAAERGESALGWIVENRLIQHVLWQALQAETRVRLRMNCGVASIEVDDSRRTLALDDGDTLCAQLVIAADGADSALRAMLGITTRDRAYGQRAIVAHVATERRHEFTAWQRFLPGATLAFLPLGDGRSSIVWSVPDAQAGRLLALDDHDFCRELGAAFDFRLGTITATSRRAAFPLRLRLAESYTAPRLALIGDAAHVVHPLAGQGVNLGLRDAAELAGILAAARAQQRDFAADYTLRRYERSRRSDDTLSAYAFDAIQRVFASDSLPVAAVRGLGLGIVDRFAPLKELFARHAAGR